MKPHPEQRFEPAPMGRRLWLVFTLVIVVLALVEVGTLVAAFHGPQRTGPAWLPFVAVLPAWAIVLGIWWASQIRGYLLRDGRLVIQRSLRSREYVLAGLEAVEPLRELPKRILKTWGNDGLGAVSGKFRCKDWGNFEMYLSDPAQPVLLRWKSGQILVVSPDRAQPFIEAVRRLSH